MLNNYKLLLVGLAVLCVSSAITQDTKPSLLVTVSYRLANNIVPSVSIFTKVKINKKFIDVPGITVKVFLEQEKEANLLGIVQTNKYGNGVVSFPVSVKSFWDTVSHFTLIATSEANKQYESASGEASVTKAKITVDTVFTDGIRSIVATVKAKSGNDWIPAPDVETKIIIKRSIGNLSVGDAETYTTDSSGQATAEFKKIDMPGDANGNIMLVAKTEDNELYGNISIEQPVKWGAPFTPLNTFDERTLFATRDKAPLWLLFLAGSIVVGVWSVIIYLARQIIQIRKLGMEDTTDVKQ